MKRLLIFYSQFTPAFKAGGPIRSISNLIALVRDRFVIDVVCSAYDLGEKNTLSGITPDQWNQFQNNVSVFYIRTKARHQITSIFDQRKPDLVYINGVFLPLYSWLPLALAKNKQIPVIWSPRGMLQNGAMERGLFKKSITVKLLKLFNLHRDVTWHATDDQERADILRWFGTTSRIKVIGNVPGPPVLRAERITKLPGELRLVYMSLISQKKNLKFVLGLLKKIVSPIVFDIYGPVKDEAYWKECQTLMAGQIHEINYHGPLNPNDVEHTLMKYHAFVLLTHGENFGHAIYEALNSGTPGILSRHTPWGDLSISHAGLTVDITNAAECQIAIEKFIALDQAEFNVLSDHARSFARSYYDSQPFENLYQDLFQSANN